ncbi:MAG: hypothetical protein KJ067_06500 [Vicinamibacteria bacterium]|nr:hypothetical protein [Vicinamibacteria bacterium]
MSSQPLPWRRLALAALLVLASRAPFVPPALEDYDSVNFALALHQYDPVAHQPHPPGYPVFVALGRLVHAVVPEPAAALGLLGALAQALAVLPAFALFRRLDPARAWAATLLLFTCPVVWFNGARPLSDSVGLLFILASQALLLRAVDGHGSPAAGSLAAGLAVGTRLQSLALTLPLWLLATARSRSLRAPAALAAGVLAWLCPMLVLAGGFNAFVAAFRETMGMAIGIEPLHTRFSLNMAVRAARHVLLGPWVSIPLGVAALALAAVGAVWLARHQRRGLALAVVAFGPYFAAHAAFQQVEAIRYTLPYVPLLCLLAAAGLAPLAAAVRVRGRRVAELALAAPLAAGAAVVTLPGLAVLATVPSPPEAAVDAAIAIARERAADRGRPGVVLAAHYTLERYLDRVAADFERLPAGTQDTTPRLLEYWRGGGERELLFLADTQRTDLESMDPRSRRLLGRWRWPLDADRFMPGARPLGSELLRLVRPAWVAGPGWLISLEAGTPERAALADERVAWLRGFDEPTFLLVAGQPAGPGTACSLALEFAGSDLEPVPCDVPFFAGHTLAPAGATGFAELHARPPARDGGRVPGVLLRGLDYSPRSRTGFVHGTGWHAPERDERGRPFRWTASAARSLLHVPATGARLRIDGTVPVAYVGTGGHVRLRVDGAEVASAPVDGPWFELVAQLPARVEPFREISLETDRSFRPDDRQKNGDRRELGLRVYHFDLRTTGYPAPNRAG